MKGFISKYCRTNLILLDIKADWKGSISMWCECDLSGQLKPSKRANIIRMVNYVFQTILYYFVFCFIASLFFLNVYASIYVTPFLFTSVFVSFLFISFVLTLFHACLLPSFTFLSFTISFFSCFFFRRFRKALCEIGYQFRDVSPSVCPYRSFCLPMDGYTWNLILEIFYKICWHIPIQVKIVKWKLFMKMCVYLCD